VALALGSAVCSCAVLLVIFVLAAAVPAVEPTARNGSVPATPASAIEAAKKQPASSMLEASGYAIAKDKLD